MPLLSWSGRESDLARAARTPYRLLEPVPGLGYGEPDATNMLIEGDNLDALKALLPYYAGQVKCVVIDPPYNTRSAFAHYDDNLEHSQWLSMIYPRLELIRRLLAEDGSLWVTLDDNEAHYFKVVADEVFGRKNFIATVLWRKNYAPKSSAKHFSVDHDYVFVYARNEAAWRPHLMPRTQKQDKAYRNADNDPRGPWRPNNLAARNFYSKGTYPITCPGGRVVPGPPKGSYWRVSAERLAELDADGRIWWGADGNNVPAPKIYLSEVKQGVTPQTWWSYEEVGHTQEAKREIVALFGDDVFGTPKPERLIGRILEIATRPGDLVLDSFLGSGTTAAVAHKMHRHWIGIEMGDHARTHCQPRLAKVVDGEPGGISEAAGWTGGGGFRYYRLGVPVLDAHGGLRDDIGFEQLAAHVWFSETGTPMPGSAGRGPLLGVHQGVAYYLLFQDGGNVLTRRSLHSLPPFDGPKVIYGEASELPDEHLAELGIRFRQTPYDIKGR